MRHGRLDVSQLITHSSRSTRSDDAYDVFANQRDGVVKVAITP